MLSLKRLLSFAALLSLLVVFACSSACNNSENGETVDAMEVMKKIKMVRIATDAVHLPFEFGLDTGVQGFDIDIGNEIAKDLGYEPKWLKITGYNKLFESLKNGESEMIISTVAPTPELEKEFAFSQPYYESGDAIARRKSDSDIKDLASLSGKTVGVGEGRPGDLFMSTQTVASNVNLIKFHNLDEALGALNRGEINAVVADEPILAFSSQKSFRFLVTLPTDINKYQYAVAVRKNDTALLESINKTLSRMKESGEIEALREKWFEDVLEQATNSRLAVEEEERLRKAPKKINVVINKKSGSFKMDRLDGYELVLQGTSGNYRSTPILTSGNTGKCRFSTPVPPGDYTLDMSIFRTTATLNVPEKSASTLTMTMNVSTEKGIDINLK